MRRLLIQAGHVAPREPGFEPGTGTTREQELARTIQTRLSGLLSADGRFVVTLCPGDIPDGWEGDLFLALHGDGSSNTASSGYCFGYPEGSAASKAFTLLLAGEYEKLPGHPPHRKDNYTGGLRRYYGWRRVNAPVKVLVEHGFLTNPAERDWLFANTNKIALAWYRAVCAHYGYRPKRFRVSSNGPAPSTTRPKTKPRFTVVADGRELIKAQPLEPILARKGLLRKLAGKFGQVTIRKDKPR